MKELKKIYKENGIQAIQFEIIAKIWLTPIALVFVLIKLVIELPIKFIIGKIKKK